MYTTEFDKSQSDYLNGTEELLGQKVRYRVRLNSYDFQSYAIGEIWNPTTLSWNEAAKVPTTQWWVSRGHKEDKRQIALEHALELLHNEVKWVLS